MISVFILALVGLFILATTLMIYPLFGQGYRRIAWIFPFFLAAGAVLFYAKIGGWQEWMQAKQAAQHQKNLNQLKWTAKDKTLLIQRLKERLQLTPQSARGWFLLGRLYQSQKDWLLASDAFKRAFALEPNDSAIVLNYAHSLWQKNQGFDDEIRHLYSMVLKNIKDNPDALMMLAMDAYQEKKYGKAIYYWKQLAKQVPTDSNDAHLLRKAIAKAYKSLNQN